MTFYASASEHGQAFEDAWLGVVKRTIIQNPKIKDTFLGSGIRAISGGDALGTQLLMLFLS